MGSYDLKGDLQRAIDWQPTVIYYADKPKDYYASVDFYSLLVDNPQQVPIQLRTRYEPVPGSCLLYHRDIEYELEDFPAPYEQLESAYVLGPLQRLLHVEQPAPVFKLRCYPG